MSRGEDAKHEHHKKRLSELREKTVKKVQYHLAKAYIDPEDFYHLITEFFLELLEKDYAATYEEILDELETIEHEYLLFSKEQRSKASSLLRVLSQLEYSDADIAQEHAKMILRDFSSLTDEFTRIEQETVQRALRDGFHAVQKKDWHAAKKSYQKAHSLYERLGEHEKDQYFEDLQKLFALVKEH